MPQGMQYTHLEGQWLSLLKHLEQKRLQKTSVFSVMADECTDIMAVEELSVFCHWEDDSIPVKCFLDIVPLKESRC